MGADSRFGLPPRLYPDSACVFRDMNTSREWNRSVAATPVDVVGSKEDTERENGLL
jgi:hypothetical protein